MKRAGEVKQILNNGISAKETPLVQQVNKQTNKSSTLARLSQEVLAVIAGNLPPFAQPRARLVAKSFLEAIQLPRSINVLQKLRERVPAQNLAAYMLRYQNSKLNVDIMVRGKEDLEAILAGRLKIPEGAQINQLTIDGDIDIEQITQLLAKFESVDKLLVYPDCLPLPALTAIIGSIAGKKIKHLEVSVFFDQQKIERLINAIQANPEMQQNLASPRLTKFSLNLTSSACSLSAALPIGNFTPNVESLSLHFIRHGGQQFLETLSLRLPRLKDLAIHDFGVFDPEDYNVLLTIFSAGKQLESLDVQIPEIGADNFIRALREDSYKQLVLPQLQELRVVYIHVDEGAGLSVLMDMVPNLKKFSVGTRNEMNYQRIFANKDNLPIKDLCLDCKSGIKLPELVLIFKACPQLRTLELSSIGDNFLEREGLLDEASQKILQSSSAKLRDLSFQISSNNPAGLIKFLSLCENLNSLELRVGYSCFDKLDYLSFIKAINNNPAVQNILAKLDHVVLDARVLTSSTINKFMGYLKDGVVLELCRCRIPSAELASRNGAIEVKYR